LDAVIAFYDTATLPTEEMLEAMRVAPLGDDVYHSDPTVNELEAMAAELVGKDAAVLVPSGTMGNLAAVMALTSRGDEVVVEREAHLAYYEAGGLATVAGCMPMLVPGDRGVLRAQDVEAHLRKADENYPPTSLLCVENTHNRAGGTITSPKVMAELRELADRYGLRIHLDGARIFNAAVALAIPTRELAADADTVMFCLSKGLSAPVGSILAGPAADIAQARRARRMLGGGMRQAGVIAAAGIVALQKGIERLSEDHETALALARRLAALPDIGVEPQAVETNMVLVDTERANLPAEKLVGRLRAEFDIRASARPPYTVRFVTHRHIGTAEVSTLVEAMTHILETRLG
jgi:threonine aldolase